MLCFLGAAICAAVFCGAVFRGTVIYGAVFFGAVVWLWKWMVGGGVGWLVVVVGGGCERGLGGVVVKLETQPDSNTPGCGGHWFLWYNSSLVCRIEARMPRPQEMPPPLPHVIELDEIAHISDLAVPLVFNFPGRIVVVFALEKSRAADRSQSRVAYGLLAHHHRLESSRQRTLAHRCMVPLLPRRSVTSEVPSRP